MASFSAAGGQTLPNTGAAGQPSEAAYVVNQAKTYLGTPYVWGGESAKGFDCSGLLQYTWGKAGVAIPRTTYAQFTAGTPVARNDLQPGDAVFFTGSDPLHGLPGHVGIYIGGGKFIEAPHTGATVQISTLAGRTDFVGARRYGVGTTPSSAVSAATTPERAAAGVLPGPQAGTQQGPSQTALKALLARSAAVLRAPAPPTPALTPYTPPVSAPTLAPAAPPPLTFAPAPTTGPLAALPPIHT